jgi:hypothetical protein
MTAAWFASGDIPKRGGLGRGRPPDASLGARGDDVVAPIPAESAYAPQLDLAFAVVAVSERKAREVTAHGAEGFNCDCVRREVAVVAAVVAVVYPVCS